MNFSVVFSKQTGRIRSIYVPQSETEDPKINLTHGEDVTSFDMGEYGGLDQVQELLNKQTGIVPKDDRYVIVDSSIKDSDANTKGNIIGVVIADPGCGDVVPGKEMLAHPVAGDGWKWTASEGFENVKPTIIGPPKG